MVYVPTLGNGSLFSINSNPISNPTTAATLNEAVERTGITPVRGGGSIVNGTLFPYEPIVFTEQCDDIYVQEKHISVIRKGPTAPVTLEMFSYTRADQDGDGLIEITAEFTGDNTNEFVHTSVDNIIISGFFSANKDRKEAGDTFILPILNNITDFIAGDTIIISFDYVNSFGVNQTATCRAVINEYLALGVAMECTLLTNAIGFPISTDQFDVYKVTLVQGDPMFELKFPKFSYRYKYEDGEYSVFAPWSQIAFIPGKFDFMPKKGYNLGMTNRLRSLKILDWVPKNIPKDVSQVDILFKQSNSPNVYTVESFKKDDVPKLVGTINPWNTQGTGANFGNYTVTSELIHATVASNQMLRPWDNVPRVALAQEITANRLVFANYIQNYDTVDYTSTPPTEIKPMFEIVIDYTDVQSNPELVGLPGKSLKSMRSYQLGVVYRDRYGRETPVLTSESATFKIKKESAKKHNRLNVGLASTAPDWAESFTIYIKETANEYYNLAMDRWYDAEDGGIWVSFPSSERNKISEDTILYLKKQHDTDVPVDTEVEYKVISIDNNAPTFIKTNKQFWGGVPMHLPPAGWGSATYGKPGGWASGMFASTGLPLLGRLYLDVFAEYAEQTILSGLSAMNRDGLQIRITQSTTQLTTYGGGSGGGQNKSNWYNIARISYIGEEQTTYTESYTDSSTGITTEVEKEETNAKHPLIRITLEKALGQDMLFTNPPDNLDLATGLALEVRNSIVRNKAQFEGRFFVKLHRSNDLVRNIIQPSNPVGDAMFVLESRGVKYISDAHPGVQDWSVNVPSHIGNNNNDVSTPPFKNYISPGVDLYSNGSFNGNIAPDPYQLFASFNNSAAVPHQVSSYSAGAAGAEYTVPHANYLALAPSADCRPDSTTPHIPYVGAPFAEQGCWPFSPGPDSPMIWPSATGNGSISGWANKYGNKTWYGNRYKQYVTDNGQTPGSSPLSYDWPSFFPSQWIFKSYHDSTTSFNLQTGDPIPAVSLGDKTKLGNFGVRDTILEEIADDTNNPNPWMKPAIWGDDPFVVTPFKRKFSTTGIGGGLGDLGVDMTWSPTTNERLSRDWMGYWNTGSGSDDTEWPFVRVSWDRWFIDKVGAAEGYAGSGIWDDGVVSHIAISYWGIGTDATKSKIISDPHDMSHYQENELSFANALSAKGTMFRFKQDPDQTVYTITSCKIDKVYNYEGFHGSWGHHTGNMIEDPSDITGATMINEVNEGGVLPPLKPFEKTSSGIAGAKLFYSDIWQGDELNQQKTGRAMQNIRLRFNLTLDKMIGLGPNNFHPILNHVGPAGPEDPGVVAGTYPEGSMISNIPTAKGVRDRVYYDKTAADHVGVEKGGTPCPLGHASDETLTKYSGNRHAYYNLHSYWNSFFTSGVEQPNYLDHTFYTHASNQAQPPYIGLHERGLNETTIEIVDFYDGEEGEKKMSNNPAIFETEPKEDVGMDLYYAASPSYPVNLKRYRFDTDTEPGFYDYGLRGEEFIPVGSMAVNALNDTSAQVDGVQENRIWVNTPLIGLQLGQTIDFTTEGEGTYYGIKIDNNYTRGIVSKIITDQIFEIEPEVHSNRRSLGYFNCYSFGNGVESNRIRDDYNAVTIDKGVKVSAPLAEGYEEERRASSFIFSGIYNSTSGINRTNEFIQAEPITKDLNPINGSIQKLFARDTDLVTFCENKVFRVLSKKDALFNADGNKNITSNAAVLGATTPFEGEYGMSRNPESFASESYRVYFADKDRGAVLRLSKSGLRPISDNGMKDWFKDNLMNSSSLIGSFDDREDQYNLTIETKDQDLIDNAFTLSFSEARNGGWVSFKSFISQGGISYKNKYYTFPSNKFNTLSTANGSDSKKLYGDEYGNGTGMAEMWHHHIDLDFHRFLTVEVKGATSITLSSGGGVIVVGMNVEGNGVPIDTVVVPGGFGNTVKLSNPIYVEAGGELRFTSARNNFYNVQSHSMVRTLFNGDQGTVKRFKSLNYEGSQGKLLQGTNDGNDNYELHLDATGLTTVNVGQIYTNNYAKEGWEVFEIKTDLQDGSIKEFVDKENKWFNYIRGFEDAGFGDDVDTSEFSAQGLGFSNI